MNIVCGCFTVPNSFSRFYSNSNRGLNPLYFIHKITFLFYCFNKLSHYLKNYIILLKWEMTTFWSYLQYLHIYHMIKKSIIPSPRREICIIIIFFTSIYWVYNWLDILGSQLNLLNSQINTNYWLSKSIYWVHNSIYWVHNLIYWVHNLIYWVHSSIYWAKNLIYLVHNSILSLQLNILTLQLNIYWVHNSIYWVVSSIYWGYNSVIASTAQYSLCRVMNSIYRLLKNHTTAKRACLGRSSVGQQYPIEYRLTALI